MTGILKTPSLLAEMCEESNLTQAWRKVRGNVALARRPSSMGVDEVSVAAFEQQWESNLAELQRTLLEGTYRPLPPKRIEVRKASGGTRVIGVLAVRDRVAQRAAQQVLEPRFEPQFLDCSYGFRPNHSVEDALHRIVCYHQAGCQWVFDADIAACFDSLDHRLLLRFVEAQVPEPAMLDLIQSWLEVGILAVDGSVQQRMSKIEQVWDRVLALAGGQETVALAALEDGDYSENNWELGLEQRSTWRRIRSDLFLLGLTGVPAAARRLRPTLRWLARRKRAVLGATGAVSALGLAGIWWALQRWSPQGQGALQGGALSPLLANVYLHHFDKPMVAQGHRLVRYADDLVICCETQAEAEAAAGDAARTLGDLRLRLNMDKTRVTSFDKGFRFLGRQFRGHKLTPPLKR